MEQYTVYENLGAGRTVYPMLVNLQHPVADVLHHVLVAPLVELARFGGGKLPTKVCPVLHVRSKEYAVMTPMMAGIPDKQLGQQVVDVSAHRTALRDALDFLINGY